MAPVTRSSIFFLCASFASALTTKVTPVEKVINLLKDLQKEVEEEGKKEATQYDKFACFCKEQSNEKIYMIEKSDKKIEKLTAKISELDAEITELNADISDLGLKIEGLAADIQNASDVRAVGHAAYVAEEADISGAISALTRAIDSLKASKDEMKGAKLDLAQLGKHVLSALTKVSVPQSKLDKVVALTQQKPATYSYHSNEIITTLEDLLDIFLQNKKELDTAEFEVQAEYEKNDLNMKNMKKFAEKEKAEKEAIVEAKSEEKAKAEEDNAQEKKDKGADEAFLAVLTSDCETKATNWDQRSTTRSAELVALDSALKALEEGVATTYSANKQLVALQKKNVPMTKESKVQAVGSKKGMSFLQVRGANSEESAAAMMLQRVAKGLSDAATKMHSAVLTSAAARVASSDDHFVKVRQLIKDLVSRLKADAESEATQKSFCDKAMAENVNSRDACNAEIEALTAKQSQLESEKQTLSEEIAQLAKDIASLIKALKEATELRNEERIENEKTIATAKEGLSATELALSILKTFYNDAAGGSLLQYVPPNSDREGKTVGDRAPEIWEGQYDGKQASSTGILGLLDVIQSDFQRTIETTTQDEADSQAAFEEFEADTNADVSEKTKSKSDKEARVAEIEDALVETADDLKSQNELLDAALKSLEELKTQCVDGEETYEERVAKREKEITALKEALDILENWQS